MATGSPRRATGLVLALAVCVAPSACARKHVPVDTSPELGYPACAEAGADDPGESVARGTIRSGPLSHEKNVIERFELRRTRCGYVFRSRQEWPLDISDVEVRYDAGLAPLWAWKRMTIAGAKRPDGNADLRRYELRSGEVFIKRRDAAGEVTLEKLLPGGRIRVPDGARVGAVVGPGRGVITAWLKRARLEVGAKTHDEVLDFRDMLETLEVAALERNADQFEPSLGRKVRVYTFYGRETVFADEEDVVLGDLAGMRPGDSIAMPEPEPLPTYGGADPTRQF
ncbi:MAG: hypothetical protein M3O36_14185 [Myxococcota bacterium]|nr:hypothetical protein [Myxococcota bacterium]